VNNESTTQLITAPIIATAADASSPVGQYAITVGNAVAANYTFFYINGILNVTENTSVLSIPSAFTPNGDGINDRWDIKNMNTFTTGYVSVFNRYGQQVFFSIGYAIPWDGRYNNKDLPTGVYYYLIKTNEKGKEQRLAGNVLIVR
jgi:gliding motility-associated-like protein